MKITTRGGDKGETQLGNGNRVPKDDIRVDLIGTLDECQAHIGFARALAAEQRKLETAESLLFIEKELGALMGYIALFEGCECPPVEKLDEVIAGAGSENDFCFQLPGESKLTASIHIARTVARRAERIAAPLARRGEISAQAAVYLNRLSDYLYVLTL